MLSALLLVLAAAGQGPLLAPAPRMPPGAAATLFAAPPTPEPEELTAPRRVQRGVTLATFSFRSPLPSGAEPNDRVFCRLFAPETGEPKGAVIVLPIWIERRGPRIEEAQAKLLAARGMLALVLPLAYQHERTLPGETSGRGTLSADLPRTHAAFRQSVADVRAAKDLLTASFGVPPGKVAVLGTSLGGYVAGLAFGVDRTFAACAMLLAGGNVADVIWQGSRETARLKERLVRTGITLADLRAATRAFDPIAWADPGRREDLLLVAGERDRVTPPASVRSLARAYGGATEVWLPADHYTGILSLVAVMERTGRFFEGRFAQRTTAIRAAKVFPVDGPPVEDGVVLVRGKRIVAVGRDVAIPAGAEVREFPDGWAFPGLVELHCHVGLTTSGDLNDMVFPQNPELRTLDLVSRESEELLAAARNGVTTALIIPGSGSTVGGLGTLVKTVGPTVRERIIRFPGALKVALHARGGNPARRSGDLGAGRQGLHYMLGELFAEAQGYHRSWVEFEAERGARPEPSPRLDPLRGLFRHEFPVILHAYGADDTMTAVRMLARGFGVPIILSHGEYTSIRIADVLAETGIPMNIGPRHYELEDGAVTGVAVTLARAGVPVSVCTDAPVIPLEELFLQGTMAARLGMDGEAVIRGLTLIPAKAAMAEERIGSLTPGKDADLVVTRGDLLDPRSRVLLVLVDGAEVPLR